MEASTEVAPPNILDGLASNKRVPVHVRKLSRRAKKVEGRPTKLTVEVAARILHLVMKGNYISTACRSAGITHNTLRNWKARAEELIDDPEVDLADLPPEEKIFTDFFQVLEMAEAEGESRLLSVAARGEKGWQAAMTVLERRHPEKFGRSEKRQDEIGRGNQVNVFMLESDGDKQRRVARVLNEAGVVDSTAHEVLPAADPANGAGADELDAERAHDGDNPG